MIVLLMIKEKVISIGLVQIEIYRKYVPYVILNNAKKREGNIE